MSDELTTADLLRDPGRLLALERRDPRAAEALWNHLSPDQRLRVVLAASPPQREKLITLAPNSLELTQALAPDEFAATVLALGPEDAGQLIEFSSDEQLTYVLDLTGWVREDFAPSRYETWLPLVLEAGSERLQRWLESTDLEVLALLCAHWFRVVKWLPSQDQQEPPDDLPSFTLDGVYFIDFRDESASSLPAQVLVVLKSELEHRYYEVMEAMLWESAAGMAEDARRWRGGRLQDHGFPERLEALELWARPAPGEADWRNLPTKAELGFLREAPPRSDALLNLLDPDLSLPALASGMDPAAADALKAELAYVANCAVVALDADPAQPEAVARAGREGLALVNLGLELMTRERPEEAAQVLARMTCAALARQGAAAIRALNQRAWALMRDGWLKDIPNGLHFLDPPLDRWLGGLLFPKPRCHDPRLPEGREYRAFTTREDLDRAAHALTQAEFWPVLLFDLLGLDRRELRALFERKIWPEDSREVRASGVVATWLARQALGLPGLAPLPPASLGPAVAALKAGLQGPLARRLHQSCQALADPVQAALARETLGQTLWLMAQELSGLDPSQTLEPRFVGLLVIER
ncbi:MAG: DUF6178 family protein [Desulfarculus sp.]|nr:DUF6178 family protein [Desulfarculus sp.]